MVVSLRSKETKRFSCTFLGEISIHGKIVAPNEHNFPALRELRQKLFSLHNTNLRHSRKLYPLSRMTFPGINRTTLFYLSNLTCCEEAKPDIPEKNSRSATDTNSTLLPTWPLLSKNSEPRILTLPNS